MTGDISGQKTARGELGNLTPVQHANLDTLQHWMNQARKTAKLAFAGQDVKLHQEFQVGVNTPHDLGSVLGRADIIIASVQNAANLAALQLKGWTAADTTAFVAARGNFGTVEQAQAAAKGGAKDDHHHEERGRRRFIRTASDHPKRRRPAMAGRAIPPTPASATNSG